MKKYILIMLAAGMTLLSGCTLKTNYDVMLIDTSKNDPTGNDTTTQTEEIQTRKTQETTQSIVVDITGDEESSEIDFSQYKAVDIPELDEPVDENGEWTDYVLSTDTLNALYPAPDYGENGSRFYMEGYPLILVSDSQKQEEITDVLRVYTENDYMSRYLFYNIDIQMTCTVLRATRFVTYQFEGTVYHTGNDARFEDEVEYRYYYTIDRMTGTIINLETAMGVEEAYNQIKEGRYEVVRAADSVFEKFSNELLAKMYVTDPVFEDDTDHELDFYIQDDSVYVVIWVGEDNGSYIILKLEEPSKI